MKVAKRLGSPALVVAALLTLAGPARAAELALEAGGRGLLGFGGLTLGVGATHVLSGEPDDGGFVQVGARGEMFGAITTQGTNYLAPYSYNYPGVLGGVLVEALLRAGYGQPGWRTFFEAGPGVGYAVRTDPRQSTAQEVLPSSSAAGGLYLGVGSTVLVGDVLLSLRAGNRLAIAVPLPPLPIGSSDVTVGVGYRF